MYPLSATLLNSATTPACDQSLPSMGRRWPATSDLGQTEGSNTGLQRPLQTREPNLTLQTHKPHLYTHTVYRDVSCICWIDFPHCSPQVSFFTSAYHLPSLEQSPPCDGSINVTDDDLVGALPQVDGARGGAGSLDHCGHREFRLIHT